MLAGCFVAANFAQTLTPATVLHAFLKLSHENAIKLSDFKLFDVLRSRYRELHFSFSLFDYKFISQDSTMFVGSYRQ